MGSQLFQRGERISLGNQPTVVETVNGVEVPAATVDTNTIQEFVDIPDASTIEARNPSTITEVYTNTITGKAVIWNNKTQKLTLRTDIHPINDSFTDRIVDGLVYNRNSAVEDQLPDIFRVGDFIKYPNQPDDEALYWEIGRVEYANGIKFVPENTSKNTSGVAKYVTKEVSISSPATAINVHLTMNTKDLANAKVLFKYKKASTQE